MIKKIYTHWHMVPLEHYSLVGPCRGHREAARASQDREMVRLWRLLGLNPQVIRKVLVSGPKGSTSDDKEDSWGSMKERFIIVGSGSLVLDERCHRWGLLSTNHYFLKRFQTLVGASYVQVLKDQFK